MMVAKGTFAVPPMFRLANGLLARPLSEEDVKNEEPSHLVSTLQPTCAMRCAVPAKGLKV